MNPKRSNEISSFPPKGFKSYRAGKSDIDFSKAIEIGFGAATVFIILLGCLVAWTLTHPATAKAKTIELRDCRTNEECLRLYCEGALNYVQDEKLTALCV